MNLNIFVTRQLHDSAMKMLYDNCEVVHVNPEDRVLTREELLEGVRGRDGVLCLLTDNIDEDVLEAARGARIFANYAVGYDNVDVEAATARKIMVTNTPGVLTETTADMAWALLFSVVRRVVESDKFLRAGHFKGWSPGLFLGHDITGATLGVVGAGRIGTAMARKSVGFEMKVLYTDVVRNESLEREVGAQRVSLEELLQESDFVTLHIPLMSETFHLIGKRELGLMKKTAYLINTSRGPVVDEAALAEALKSGEIAGAGLDVYEHEPEVHPTLLELNNAVLVPHIASATVTTRSKMATMAAKNLLAGLRGERPPNLVNPEVLSK